MARATSGTKVKGASGMLFVDDGGPDGERTPVVLVHSFGGSSAQWAPQLEHLRRTRRAIALDLRGHGQSSAPRDGKYTVESLAADVGAVLDDRGLDAAVLIGHGLGAKAVLEFAGGHPTRVAGLVLGAAPPRLPADDARQMIEGMAADYERMSAAVNARLLAGAGDDVRALVIRDGARVSREAGLRVIGSSLTHDPVPALEAYRGPKLAVVTPDADGPNDLHHLIADLPHEVMEGTSHWLQLDKPDEWNRIIDRFLERVDGPSDH